MALPQTKIEIGFTIQDLINFRKTRERVDQLTRELKMARAELDAIESRGIESVREQGQPLRFGAAGGIDIKTTSTRRPSWKQEAMDKLDKLGHNGSAWAVEVIDHTVPSVTERLVLI